MKIQSKEITVEIRSNSHCRYSRKACLTVQLKDFLGKRRGNSQMKCALREGELLFILLNKKERIKK